MFTNDNRKRFLTKVLEQTLPFEKSKEYFLA